MFKKIFEDIYLEKYLISEFTFGFELEGYSEINEDKEDDDYPMQKLKEHIDRLFSPAILANIPGFNNESNIHEDGSLDNAEYNEFPFEWSSPAFVFNPHNIQLVIKNLKDLKERGMIRVDDTCGFHIHIGFPKRNNEQDKALMMLWIIVNLAISDKKIKGKEALSELLKFNGIEFYSDSFAQVEYLDNLSDEIKHYDLTKEEIFEYIKSNVYSDEKFVAFRQHPQGTLEWRGPRGFLESRKSISLISKFFIGKLYPFINWISEVLDTDVIESRDYSITKKEILEEIIKKRKLFITPSKRKRYKNLSNEELGKILRKYKWVRPDKVKQLFEVMLEEKDNKLIFFGGSITGCQWVNGMITEQAKLIDSSFLDGEVFDIYSSYKGLINCEVFNCKADKGTFSKCRINNGEYRDSFFESCNIFNGNFIGAEGTTWDNIEIHDGTFDDVSIQGGRIDNANISNSVLNSVSILSGKFRNTNVYKCNIVGGDFVGGEIISCKIKHNNYIKCKFSHCNFESDELKNNLIVNNTIEN